MMYEDMFKIIREAAARHQQGGAYITPEDTICAICSASHKTYTGISRIDVVGGQQVNIHAEIVAMQNMQAAGESKAESIMMLNLMTLRPMLPCNGCIQYILTSNPENANCQVVLPDRSMPLTDVGKPAANPYAASMPFNAAVPNGSVYAAPGSVPFNAAVPPAQGYGASGGVPYGGSMPMQASGYNASMPYSGAAPAGVGSVYSQSSSSVSQPYAGAAPAPGRYVGASLPSGNAKAKNSNADYLKNRVGNLMQAGDDDDDEDEKQTKGLFGRLFNK